MNNFHVREDFVRVEYGARELRCEYWSWVGDWHWKVKLGHRGLVCFKKEHWNGSRWKVCPVEEVPGPVWDKIKLVLDDLKVASLAVQTAALQWSAARMGIKP